MKALEKENHMMFKAQFPIFSFFGRGRRVGRLFDMTSLKSLMSPFVFAAYRKQDGNDSKQFLFFDPSPFFVTIGLEMESCGNGISGARESVSPSTVRFILVDDAFSFCCRK